MTKSKQKISIMIMILILLSYLTPFINVSNAFTTGSEYIYSIHDPEYHLQYWNDDRKVWSYLITSYVGYTGKDGKFYPAYCLDADKKGVGEEAPYTVTVTEAVQNPEVWRVLCNGFPYKTAQELEVENDYDAFCATKQAIYSVIYGYNPVTRYKGGDERGVKIAKAIVKMVDIARTTTDKYMSPQIEIKEVGRLKKEGEYYTQTYSISSNVPLKDYTVYQKTKLPKGSYFANMEGIKKTNFSSNENFKIYIPQKSITSDVTSYIRVDGNCKTYPVLYGKAPNESLQDYALIVNPFENGSADKKLYIQPRGYFSAIKKSKDNNIWTGWKKNQALEGAKYGIYNIDGTIVKSCKTGKELISVSDKNGVIFNKEKLRLGEYYLQEIEAPKHYEIDNTKYYFKITEDEQEIYLEQNNTPEKGNKITIKKVASNKNPITETEKGDGIEGAKYEVRTEFSKEIEVTKENFAKGKLVDTLITDKEGNTKTIIVGEGTYYIKEVSAPNGWKLDEKIYKIDVISNGVIHRLELNNEPIEIPKLPQTGK